MRAPGKLSAPGLLLVLLATASSQGQAADPPRTKVAAADRAMLKSDSFVSQVLPPKPAALPPEFAEFLRQGEFAEAMKSAQQHPFPGSDSLMPWLSMLSGVLEVAEAYHDSGLSDKAVTLVRKLDAGLPKSPPSLLLAGLERRLLKFELASLPPSPWVSAWSQSVQGLATLMVWLAYLAIALLLFFILRRIAKMYSRKGTVLALVDSTCPAEERKASSAELNRELYLGLRNGDSRRRTLEIGDFKDPDCSELVDVTLNLTDFDELKAVLGDNDPIRLGPLSITPRQLYSLMLPFLPDYACRASGTMAAVEGKTTLNLSLEKSGTHLGCRITADSRAEALAEASDFLTFHLATWKASVSWPGYRAYRQAQRLASTGDGNLHDALGRARQLLQFAVSCDPLNFAARLQLGIVLRRIGGHTLREAIAVFRSLANDLSVDRKASGSKPMDIQPSAEGNGRNSKMKEMARYHLGLSLSRGGHGDRQQALAIFKTLSGDKTGNGKEPAPIPELEVLAKAGIAVVKSEEIEALCESDPRSPRKNELLKEIEIMDRELEGLRETYAGNDPCLYESATAAGSAALARAQFLLGSLDEAVDKATLATTRNPEIVSAHLTLAEIYLLKSKQDGQPLDDAAVEHAKHALELNPKAGRIHHLLGKLHAYRFSMQAIDKEPNFEKAQHHFQEARRLSPHHASDLALARLLQQISKRLEAAYILAESIARIKQPINDRYRLLLILVAEMGAPGNAELFQASRQAMENILDSDWDEETKSEVEEKYYKVISTLAGSGVGVKINVSRKSGVGGK